MNKMDGDEISEHLYLINFPKNIPQSEIIEPEEQIPIDLASDHDDVIIYDAKIKARKLYEKYIKPGSEFEINICSEEREKLCNLLGDLICLKAG